MSTNIVGEESTFFLYMSYDFYRPVKILWKSRIPKIVKNMFFDDVKSTQVKVLLGTGSIAKFVAILYHL